MPTDEVLSAGGSVVVARGGPQDPAFAVVVREEGEELLAITQAVPADGAVAEGSHGDLAVTSDVDALGFPGGVALPLLDAATIEQAQIPPSPKQAALAVRGEGQTTGDFVGLELQGSAVEAWSRGVAPIADLEAGGRSHRGRQGTVRRWFEGQDAVAYGKAGLGLFSVRLAKLHSGARGIEPEPLQESTEIRCGWPLEALRLPSGIQHAPGRICCPKDYPARCQRQ